MYISGAERKLLFLSALTRHNTAAIPKHPNTSLLERSDASWVTEDARMHGVRGGGQPEVQVKEKKEKKEKKEEKEEKEEKEKK